jgi:deoxyribodipyrimidine photolyase-related protein
MGGGVGSGARLLRPLPRRIEAQDTDVARMTTLRFVLGDQLTRDIASLRDIDKARDVVLMVEVAEEATYVRHHKQKIVFVFSAMRHFAQALAEQGITVDYVLLDDPANTGTFTGELARAVARHRASRVVVTEPGEWRVMQVMQAWPYETEIREDDRFIVSHRRFRQWAAARRTYRMEFLYRELRRETGLLMEGGEPAGGQWNFDRDNRKRLPKDVAVPRRQHFAPDAVTRAVMALVASRFADHFGDLEPFGWAVTRADALAALHHFVRSCLANFGDYQDAMKSGEAFLFHSALSPYLNVGLLTARELCDAAEAAWRAGDAPLNAVEGFIRQILGWREYVRGIYWSRMPDYRATNALGAERKLPWFYWSGETPMNCMKQAIGDIRRNAYGHHIQRLMVTGNFALLAGIAPAEIEAWYLSVYADAYEWVELPNVHGMAMFADGGLLASKPYAASGAYINRMSDYCAGCEYDPSIKSGPKACPFNYLYWDFLIRNERLLSGNPRMAMPYRTLAGFPAARRAEIAKDAASFLEGL